MTKTNIEAEHKYFVWNYNPDTDVLAFQKGDHPKTEIRDRRFRTEKDAWHYAIDYCRRRNW